jgi:UDP-4-amino-4,6-dideoxy-N-acetyl-beta-L-altrosamine N-acetyltransferase
MEAGRQAPSVVDFTNLSETERAEVLEWRNDPETRKRMFSTHEISLEEHAKFLERLRSDSSQRYWLVRGIGVISLKRLDLEHRNAFLGIYKNPRCQQPGVAQELMRVLLEKAFDELKLHTLKLEVFSDNRRAITFYNKCAFNQEGRLRELYLRPDGVYVDLILMGITEYEYRTDFGQI